MSLFDELNNLEKHSIEVPAIDESLRKVIDFALNVNEIKDPKIIGNTSLIVEEAFVNVAHYSGSPNCEVNVFPNDESYYIELIDSGERFDPLKKDVNPYSKTDMNRIGGLGILIVERMSLGVDYQYKNNKNHLLIKLKRR